MSKVLYEKRGRIALVTLNRPEVLNCIDLDLSRELIAVWERIKADREVRAVVLQGVGRAFCSGADLKALIPHIAAAPDEENRRRAHQGPGWGGISGRYQLFTPLIAAIHGYCLAGGHELAEFCDIRIASEDAIFGHPEIRWGLMPGDGGCTRLARIVGLGRAMEIILTGKQYDVQEAYRIGFVNQVVKREELLPTALHWAETIAANGPLATRAAKEAVLHNLGRPVDDGIQFETDAFNYLCQSEDWQRGQKAFLERGTAEFLGR